MLPTKREQMLECMDAIENGMEKLYCSRFIWPNSLVFWLCKAVLLLLEKECKNES